MSDNRPHLSFERDGKPLRDWLAELVVTRGS
jgi:hypothetical protein